MKIILASNSPRRQELLKGLDVDFRVEVKKGIDESYPEDMPINQVPEYLSMKKASAYEIGDDELLLTADTLVILDGKALGKPKDASQAKEMLHSLSGKTHQVITGVSFTTKDRQHHFSVSTDVTFKQLSDEEIDYYITNYKPFDKAGSYGIQEWIGYIGVTSLHGSYFNVMGLPVQRIYEELKIEGFM
jgi:septum formation protein